MPPRLKPPTASLVRANTIYSSSSPSLFLPSTSICFQCQCRLFSVTPSNRMPLRRERREDEKGKKMGFFRWLNEGVGSVVRRPAFEGPNYLGDFDPRTKERLSEPDEPFQNNIHYTVHPVLSVDLRREVWRRVMAEQKGVREVSGELGIELERVAACARLGEVEKKWREEGKPLATELTKALHNMMPVTNLDPYDVEQTFLEHESHTDLPIHPATHIQLFLPVAESQDFRRQDAADVLGLLPAEKRINLGDLVDGEEPETYYDIKADLDKEAKQTQAETEAALQAEHEVDDSDLTGKDIEGLDATELEEVNEEIRAELERLALEEGRKQRREEQEMLREKSTTMVETSRWRFRLRNATTGKVGFRYGHPHEDRKRGQIKIPTKVV